jgi:hypothetical protein
MVKASNRDQKIVRRLLSVDDVTAATGLYLTLRFLARYDVCQSSRHLFKLGL